MASMKEKDVLAEKTSGRNWQLSSTGRDKYGILPILTPFGRMVYKVPFKGLLEAGSKSDIYFGTVMPILNFRPSGITFQKAHLPSAWQELLDLQVTSCFVELLYNDAPECI